MSSGELSLSSMGGTLMDEGRFSRRGGGGFGATFGVSFDGSRPAPDAVKAFCAAAEALVGLCICPSFSRFCRGSTLLFLWSFAVSFSVCDERRKERCGRIGCGLTICLGVWDSLGPVEGCLTSLPSLEPYFDSNSCTSAFVGGIGLSSL